MDYLVSEEAQGYVSNSYLLPGRKDIPCSKERLGYDSIHQFSSLDWNYMAANGTKIATDFVKKLR